MESSVDENEPTVSEEDAKKAEEQKNIANSYFKENSFEESIKYYSSAIELNPLVAVYHGNRSFAYLKLESYGYALIDATKALELDKKYIKGYYRRASANMAIGKFKQALCDFEAVKTARPRDKDAITKYNECNKIVRQMAFEKAIAVESSHKKPSETIDVESIEVEVKYEGPKFDEEISQDFMTHLVQWFKDQKKLHRKYAFKIVLKMLEVCKALPSLVDVTIPDCNKFTVCGDIHGQYYDLLNIFHLNGLPSPDNPYLFNGDFVDRGSFSVEVILVLFGFRVLYRDSFYMSRGNHESENLNTMYGFKGEVLSKYTSQMMELFSETFNWLPLAHCIEGKILVTHGGLFSEDGVTLDDIRSLNRNREPPDSGVMCDLLWSDPHDLSGRAPSKRGVGVHFGPDVTESFLKKNDLKMVIRSHEVKQEGYELSHGGKCITVFSAPNYCDQMGNKGAFITLTKDLIPRFTTFNAVPHPQIKPMEYAPSLFRYLS